LGLGVRCESPIDAGTSAVAVPGSSEDEHLANNVSEVVGPTVVPEPPSLLLFGIALPLAGGFWLLRRRLPILANT
jgi:hypothetical protein